MTRDCLVLAPPPVDVSPAPGKLLRFLGYRAVAAGELEALADERPPPDHAKEREQNRIPVEIAPGKEITLSPGEHSELIRAIIERFAPRFAPGSVLVYAGDTGDKWGYFDAPLLAGLGVDVDSHGKMPTWCCTSQRKTGCCWSSPSPVTARSMASVTPSWRSCSPDRLPDWSM